MRAEIYSIDWNIVTGTAIEIGWFRSAARSHQVLTDQKDIAELVRLLAPERLSAPPANPSRHGDFRLLVDLYRPDGTKETFAASRGGLVRESDWASRDLDDAFRSHFPR